MIDDSVVTLLFFNTVGCHEYNILLFSYSEVISDDKNKMAFLTQPFPFQIADTHLGTQYTFPSFFFFFYLGLLFMMKDKF